MLVVGIDVGGTHIKFGLVENGNIIKNMEQGTNAFDIIRQLCNGAREIVQSSDKSWEEIDGIAIGFPGMVIDSVVMDSPNVSLQNCNLKEILEKELGKYVVVKNDAEMATLAEHKLGAGADCENMVMVTLGTGVGGGIIADRKLYVGAGGAGELGHILFERNGRACSCGRKGCAEQYVSMIALDKLAKDIMVGYPNTCCDFNGDGMIYASELARAYKRNDACAIEVVDKYVEDLTQYLLDLCNIFRPNRIVIGGGITHAPELIDMVARNCRRLEYGYKNSPKVDVLAAQLGNKAGILGGYVCLEEELNAQNVDEEYINEIEEEINLNSQNMSLLDSISLRLDKPVAEPVIEENSAEVVEKEEESGLYVNKFLDDISTEINTIKNEQLFDEVSEPVENNENNVSENTFDTFNNLFEPVKPINDEVQPINEEVQPINEEVQLINEEVSEPEEWFNTAEQEPVNNVEVESAPVEEEESTGITVDSLLESLKNTTANLNSAMNKVEGMGSFENVSPVNSYAEPSASISTEVYNEDVGVGLGISDIFFNDTPAVDNVQAPVAPIESIDNVDEIGEEQYSEEEMQETEVVYDDNLLSRVNAILNKKNQE